MKVKEVTTEIFLKITNVAIEAAEEIEEIYQQDCDPIVQQEFAEELEKLIGNGKVEVLDTKLTIKDIEDKDGWIPCSVSEPKELGVLYEVTRKKDISGAPMYITDYAIFGTDEKWHCRDEVVAWRFKTKPYIPEGGEMDVK